MTPRKKCFAVLLFTLGGMLHANDYLTIVDTTEKWLRREYTPGSMALLIAYEQMSTILRNPQLSREEKIQQLQKEFPKAFQAEEKPRIFQKPAAQDLNKSVEWLQKAAEQGLAEAQYELGLYYIKGSGVEQNLSELDDDLVPSGPGQNDRYTAVLSQFLKVKWQEYSPSLANLRDDATVGVKLVISPEGRLISGTIIRSSGNTEMDAAARRLIAHLQTITLPKNPGGKHWENTVNLGPGFNNW